MGCRHNLNYWMFGDYIGIGAGAHGKISFPDRVTREARYRQPGDYMRRALAGNAVQTLGEVPQADLAFEFMMNAMRLTAGFESRLFAERTGLPLATVLKATGTAGTYVKTTFDSKGREVSGVTQLNLATDVTGLLPYTSISGAPWIDRKSTRLNSSH